MGLTILVGFGFTAIWILLGILFVAFCYREGAFSPSDPEGLIAVAVLLWPLGLVLGGVIVLCTRLRPEAIRLSKKLPKKKNWA